jgi:hypothetical protein
MRDFHASVLVGPYADLDTHEALAQSVAADGTHGTGSYSNTIVVGKFLGAQMSAMAAAAPIGLIDHLPDGEVGVAYPTRSVVIAGDTNFIATSTGVLPTGMAFDPAFGQVYGTPYEAGVFTITVTATASNNPVLTKTYRFMVAAGGVALPPHSSVDTSSSPAHGGTTAGDGVYTNGTATTVTAVANAGYGFANWTENGMIVSTSASYTFTNLVNRSLEANFVAAPTLSFARQSNPLLLAWPTNFSRFILQQNSDLNTTNWGRAIEAVGTAGTNYHSTILCTNGLRFFRLTHP